jgi:antitoxin MazE
LTVNKQYQARRTAMTSTIAMWGNSLALRLPRNLAEGAKLQAGTQVEIAVEEGKRLVVTPARPRYKLAELLAKMPEQKHDETDWGRPEGDEVW